VTNNARSDTDRFVAMFDRFSRRVYAYVRRHADLSVVDDIVSETFLVAWRRLDKVPDEPLPWLLVVARNSLANQRRTLARHDGVALESDALDRLVSAEPAVDDVVIGRQTMVRALQSLTPDEREALLLIAWDGLTPAEAGEVAGCSDRTFRVRLHRARQGLARAIETAGHITDLPVPALLKETS
jgi:RNA polymerase sigma-70 factor, ECF subfamily